MKKTIIFIILSMFLTFNQCIAVNITGQWIMSSVVYKTCQIGQCLDRATIDNNAGKIVISSTLSGSGDFVGEFYDSNDVLYGTIKGRVVKATPPYTENVVLFERVDYGQTYYLVFCGLLTNDSLIQQGHFVDTFGNTGTFVLTKQP